MNCYDCATAGDHRAAVAVCSDCGAAVCVEHSVSAAHWLTRTRTMMRVERIQPPARVIRCGTCHAARGARGDVAAAEPRPLSPR